MEIIKMLIALMRPFRSINRKAIFFQLALFYALSVTGQKMAADSIQDQTKQFTFKTLVVPTVLIGYGIIGLENDQLKILDSEISEEVTENIDGQVTFDDFSQYLPALSVYGLNAVGIKGKHNFKDRTIILATSYLIMGTSVLSLKAVTNVQRPDGSTYNSFPSGHTATAFMGAEFLWQEYKDVSIWYGIAGYGVATATGVFRIMNNRHWLSDVAMGAGIGILSTKLAYWIHPFIQEKIFKGKKQRSGVSTVVPFYNGEQAGLGFSKSF
jgi:hypothetical protein